MYIWSNAFKNITRNKGRNILIGIILLTLITVSMIALSINNTTTGIIDDYKTRFGSEVTIGADLSQFMTTGGSMTWSSDYTPPPPITPEQYLAFAQSEYLKEYQITASASAGGDIKAIDEGEGIQMGGSISVIGGTQTGDEYISPKLTVWGDQWEDFQKGMRQLVEGEMPENDGECIISTELATLNDCTVGDTIKLQSSKFEMVDGNTHTTTVTVEFTITGIYLDATEPYAGAFKMPSANRRNEVLTTLDTLLRAYEGSVSVTAKYYLKSPSMLDDFTAELRTAGLDAYYKVSADVEGYQKVIGPVEGLKKISLTFMVIILAFGAIILVLLSSIAIRERKYEIGVLRAMGMKKHKVALGLWGEMLIITAFCLCAGFGIGKTAAQPVSNTLLAGQIESAKAAAQGQMQGGFSVITMSGMGTMELVPLEEVDVSVGIVTILEIAGIALLLASLASVVAISKVTKYEPIEILMERN